MLLHSPTGKTDEAVCIDVESDVMPDQDTYPGSERISGWFDKIDI